MTYDENAAERSVIRANLVAGLLMFLGGVFIYLVVIPGYVVGADADHTSLGPAFMPRISVAAMAAFGLFLGLNASVRIFFGGKTPGEAEESQDNDRLEFGRTEIENTVMVIAIAIAYIALLRWAGYLMSTIPLLCLLIYGAGYRRITVLVAAAILAPLALQQVLWGVLYIRLPGLPDFVFSVFNWGG